MRPRRLRAGELVALAGAICVIVAVVALRWYETPSGSLDAAETFGPAIILLLLSAIAGFALALATVTERSTALPIAAAVWSTGLGIVGVIAAIVRLLERPDGASGLCAGAWVAFAGALLLAIGSWQSMRDERQGLYRPASPEPREPPPA